jgi:hypothetical protein
MHIDSQRLTDLIDHHAAIRDFDDLELLHRELSGSSAFWLSDHDLDVVAELREQSEEVAPGVHVPMHHPSRIGPIDRSIVSLRARPFFP